MEHHMSALLDWFEMESRVWRDSVLCLLTTKVLVILSCMLSSPEAAIQNSVSVTVFGSFASVNDGWL
jgi:hypothetical protein